METEDTDFNGIISEAVSIRMTAMDFALRHGGPKEFTYGEVIEAAEAFESFLKGDQ